MQVLNAHNMLFEAFYTFPAKKIDKKHTYLLRDSQNNHIDRQTDIHHRVRPCEIKIRLHAFGYFDASSEQKTVPCNRLKLLEKYYLGFEI